MSFILDALKKSETERQRRDTPGISDVPRASASTGGPRWLWIVAILLAGNLVAITVVLLWTGRGPAGASVEQPPAQVETRPVARQRPPPAMVAEPEPEPARQAAAQPDNRMPRPEAAAPAATQATPAPQQRRSPPPVATVTEGLPTFNEVRANGTINLPDLHLDIHVYSEQPSGRFVFVNMKKYAESGRLEEGPVVREITPDGVVLEHMGTGFLLPRE